MTDSAIHLSGDILDLPLREIQIVDKSVLFWSTLFLYRASSTETYVFLQQLFDFISIPVNIKGSSAVSTGAIFIHPSPFLRQSIGLIHIPLPHTLREDERSDACKEQNEHTCDTYLGFQNTTFMVGNVHRAETWKTPLPWIWRSDMLLSQFSCAE